MKGLEVWKMKFPFRLSFSRGHVDFSGVEQVDPKFIIGENFVNLTYGNSFGSIPCTVYVFIYIYSFGNPKIQDDFQPNY